MTIDPISTDVQNIYKLLIGVIVPRPIAFVSTVSSDGVPNLAPYSFFTCASANPPVVCFCPMVRRGQPKDTLANVRATREFVVNIVSEEIAGQMNITSGDYSPEIDEFEKSGLTKVASGLVKPPRVLESPVNMECKLTQIVDVSTEPMGGSLVLGEVVRFHVRDELVENFRIDPDLLQAIGRMGGPTYTRTRDRFDLERPRI